VETWRGKNWCTSRFFSLCLFFVRWLATIRAMQSGNFAGEYPTKTDEELSRAAMDLGPPLPSEIAKAPWRPKAAGVIAFFFGPVAGALVVAISLRRLGYQQRARKVMFLALGAAAVEAAILFFVPDVMARLVGFGAEIAFLLFFPVYMEGAFNEWQASDPSARPSSGWSALGWGLIGTVVFLLIIFLVSVELSPLLPEGW
jgi:hypothetical protein